MTIPDHFAGHVEEVPTGLWVRLEVWLRVRREEARQRRAERRRQALLRSLGPTVLEDIGYEVAPDAGVGEWLAANHPMVISVRSLDRRG